MPRPDLVAVTTQGSPMSPESHVAMICPARPSPILQPGDRAASMIRWVPPALEKPEDLLMCQHYDCDVTATSPQNLTFWPFAVCFQFFKRLANRVFGELRAYEAVTVTLLAQQRVSPVGPRLRDATPARGNFDVVLPSRYRQPMPRDIEDE